MEGDSKLDLGRSLLLALAELNLERLVHELEIIYCCPDSLWDFVMIYH